MARVTPEQAEVFLDATGLTPEQFENSPAAEKLGVLEQEQYRVWRRVSSLLEYTVLLGDHVAILRQAVAAGAAVEA